MERLRCSSSVVVGRIAAPAQLLMPLVATAAEPVAGARIEAETAVLLV